MRRILLFGLVMLSGATMQSCTPDTQEADAAATDNAVVPARDAELAPQEAQEAPAVTARGIGIHGDGWAHRDEAQAPVAATVRLEDNRAYLQVGHSPDNLREVGMMNSVPFDLPDGEGKLCRMHAEYVSASEPSQKPLILILGFYDALCSTNAVMGQRYSCARCDGIIVCGVNPSCN